MGEVVGGRGGGDRVREGEGVECVCG
jgi:hypothetical protein